MNLFIRCCYLFSPFLFLMGCSGEAGEAQLPDTNTQGSPRETLFELQDSSSTGVAFSNNIKEQSHLNYFNANYLYIGGGVGAGDFNNDGLIDLYFVAVTGESKLFFNKGGFQFEDVTQRAGVGLDSGVKTGVSVVDINADGWLDIYQCRTGQEISERGNKLFINQQDGTFKEESEKYGLSTFFASTEANFFDYDLDGDLDVYIINRPVNYATNNKVYVENVNGTMQRVNKPTDDLESDRLLRNNGNLTFTDVSLQSGINNRAFSLSVNILDINEDGLPDIYVANDYLEPDHIYINHGDPKGTGVTFKDEWDQYLRHLSYFSMGVDIADLNNDGLMDIVTLDMLPPDNYTHKQNGTSMKWDKYKSLILYQFGHQIMRNMLQLNNGHGGFQEIACLAGIQATDWSWAPLIADFDNDGWKDIFITNGMKKDVNDLDFANFELDSIRASGTAVSDFSQLVKFIPSHKPSNYMFRNSHDLVMEDVSAAWGVDQKSFSNGAAYVDIDNDGDLDLVVHNTDDVAFIYKNKSREEGLGAYLQILLEGPPKNPSGVGAKVELVAGDITQVLEKQLSRGFFSSSDQPLHFGLGKSGMVDKIQITWPDGKVQILQDVPANQRLAIRYNDAEQKRQAAALPVVPCQDITDGSGLVYNHVDNPFEDFDQERMVYRKYSNSAPALAVGDLNGDGLEDVFIGGSFLQAGTTFIQYQPGKFKEMPQPVLEQGGRREDVDAVFFDANGDGALDLYLVSGGVEAPVNKPFYVDRLFINNGEGQLLQNVSGLPHRNESASCVNVFDFDQDGDLDIAVGGGARPGAFPLFTNSFLLKNEKGNFTDATAEWAPGFAELGIVNAIEFADLNGDSRPEMVVAGEWTGITVFEIDRLGFKNVTANFGLSGTEGWWHCLKIADLNGDGHPDIIAGNMGLNNRLKATPQEPIEVFALDIDQNGTLDPILTYFNNGKRYPLVHRDVLISQVPAFKKKFIRYRTYSKATLDDLLSKTQQEQAVHLKANLLANSVFWGSASGAFTREDLPPAAQVSPIMSMAIKDINGDGIFDVLAVGNDYGLEIESGRMDASDGWVMLGSKDGKLKVVPNKKTGFWSSGQGRGIATMDLPGTKDFLILVGNNNDKAGVYKWTGDQPF